MTRARVTVSHAQTVGDLVALPPAWMLRGACASPAVDADLWFTEGRGNPRAAQLCRSCPVVAQCLAYALSRDEWGVWGGASRRERRRIQRAHQQQQQQQRSKETR